MSHNSYYGQTLKFTAKHASQSVKYMAEENWSYYSNRWKKCFIPIANHTKLRPKDLQLKDTSLIRTLPVCPSYIEKCTKQPLK